MKERCIYGIIALALIVPLVAIQAPPALAYDYIKIIAPAAGDILYSNTSTDIKWTNTPGVTKIDLYYSTDGGASYSLIQSDISPQTNTDQALAWTVPVADSAQCQLKYHIYVWLFGQSSEADQYSDVFQIKSVGSPSELTAEALSESSIKIRWKDNVQVAGSYCVDRRGPAIMPWEPVKSDLAADATEWTDTGLEADSTYEYRVYFRPTPSTMYGEYSNTASATTWPAPAQAEIMELEAPVLTATATADGQILLEWTDDNANLETGYHVFKQIGSTGTMQSFMEMNAVDSHYPDTNVTPGTTYFYQIQAYGSNGESALSNIVSATPAAPNSPSNNAASVVLKYYIGQMQYLVNDVPVLLDSPPAVMESHILLPIKFVTDPLGGTTAWNQDTKQATINCNGHVLVLTLNSPTATVDGMNVQIDIENSAVMPVAQNNRILMPLRFVGESLDCAVQWNQLPQEAVLTYPDPEPAPTLETL